MPLVYNGTKRLGLRFASMRSSIIYIILKINSFVRDQLAEAISLMLISPQAMEGMRTWRPVVVIMVTGLDL